MLTGLEPHHTVLLLLCPWTFILSPKLTTLRVLWGKLSSWMSGRAPRGNKPLTWSGRWFKHPTLSSMSRDHSLDHSWCAPKQGRCYSPLRDPSGDPSGHPLHVFATSIGENCTAELIQLYKKRGFYTDLFFSHISPMARFTQWPHKLALDKGCFPQQQHHLKDMLGSCLNSLDPTFLSFHCISEKQEAAAHKHHASFRARREAHQKATGIFLLVLVGFSYGLHSF